MNKDIKKLTAVLFLFGLMALGSSSTGSGDTKSIVTSDSAQTDSNVATNTSKAESTKNSITISEQELLNQSGIIITAKSYETGSIWGDGIKIMVENTSDKDVGINCNAVIVNNYMISDLFSTSVAAGKKANDTIHLSTTDLNAAGIDTIGQIELYFHVYDSDSYDKIFDSECITIKTSAYDQMDTTPNDTGSVLYESDGIKIVGKTMDENSFWGTSILLYCENNTDKNITVHVDDMSINGFMMTPYFVTTVYSNKKSIEDITILSTQLEENDIKSIEEVELKFRINDSDTYDKIVETDPIKFSAK